MAKMISHGSLDMRTIIFVWVAIFVVYSHNIIEGRHISREDYLEAKRLVKLSRRPSVKIIQVDNGDIFDCVIIHKQLAFEHPALKNHTIRMKPTSIPEWQKDEGSNHTSLYIGLKGGGCPVGSIPVRRLQISDILRSTSVSSFGRKHPPQEHHHAVVQSYGEFSGAKASVNLWNPDVAYNQFSLSQLWIINESPYGAMETIEAGWMVYPGELGDYKTRLFTYWTQDGHTITGCYNKGSPGCPGFVQISPRFQVGEDFPATSSYDGPQHYATIMVSKETSGGDWWLNVDGDRIGYWPNGLFDRLSTGESTRVDWGGEVSTLLPRNRPWPEMGSGHFPDEDNFLGKSSTISDMQVYHRGMGWEDSGYFGLLQSKPNCYTVIDGGNDFLWSRHMAFGGPGGEY